MASMVAWVASRGGVVGFDGVDGGGFDGVDGGMGGFDGVDGGLAASMASNGGVECLWTGVFDTEGTDVEVPLCHQL